MAYDLIIHSRTWSLVNFGDSKRSTEIIEVVVGNYSDPAYVTTLIIGFGCSVLTLIVLITLVVRERKRSA